MLGATISSGDGEDTAAPCALRAEVRRTFRCARRSPFLSPCNHRLRQTSVKDQGDAAGWQSYDSEPSHHAEGIKGFSDIDTKYNARRRGTLIHRASEDHGCRADNEDANEGKHCPRDENSVAMAFRRPGPCPACYAVPSRLPSVLWRIPSDELWCHSFVKSVYPRGSFNAHWFSLFNAVSFQVMMGAPIIVYAKSLGASSTVLGIIAAFTP